jgi:glycosyltransferase involved in cell wall biosynthesis
MDEKTVLRTRSRIAWMGRHSGYDRGCDYLEDCSEHWRFIDVHRSTKPLGPFRRRYLDRRRRGCSKSPLYDAWSYLLEREVERTAARERPDIVHLMYLEKDLGILEDGSKRDTGALIATAHQPRSWWNLVHGSPEVVRALDGLVVLSEREAEYWEGIIPGRVFMARHGVDVDFFCPAAGSTAASTEPRCLVVGHWLRDLSTLAEVVDLLQDRVPRIGFDIVIPLVARSGDALLRLARHDSVRFLAGLSDEELRDLYRRSALLLLPMLDATANNAILEAQACGTPIVSTNVGGVASYVAPSFADLLPVGDVKGLADAVECLVSSDGERRRRGRAAREHAVEKLSWRRLAPRAIEIYEDVLERAVGSSERGDAVHVERDA